VECPDGPPQNGTPCEVQAFSLTCSYGDQICSCQVDQGEPAWVCS
jgi:hypothetical protein